MNQPKQETLRNRGRQSGGLPIKRSFLMTPEIDAAIGAYTANDPTHPTFSQAVRALLIKGLAHYGITV